jgi:hypothetical protein
MLLASMQWVLVLQSRFLVRNYLVVKQANEVLVSAPNYAFKPTAGEVGRSNQPLPAGGGLTRR